MSPPVPVKGEVFVKARYTERTGSRSRRPGAIPKAPKRAAWGSDARLAWARAAGNCNVCRIVAQPPECPPGDVWFVHEKPEPAGPRDVEDVLVDVVTGRAVAVGGGVGVAVVSKYKYASLRCDPQHVGSTWRLPLEEFYAEGWERP